MHGANKIQADAEECLSEYLDISLQRDVGSVLYAYMLNAKQQSNESNLPQNDAAKSVSEYVAQTLATNAPFSNVKKLTLKSRNKIVGIDSQSDTCASVSKNADEKLVSGLVSVQMNGVNGSSANKSVAPSQSVVFGNPISLEVLIHRSQQLTNSRQVLPTLVNGQLFFVPAGDDDVYTALPSASEEKEIVNLPTSAAQVEFLQQCLAKIKLFLGAEFTKFENFYNEHVGHTDDESYLKTALEECQSNFELNTAIEKQSSLETAIEKGDPYSELNTAVDKQSFLKTTVEQTD